MKLIWSQREEERERGREREEVTFEVQEDVAAETAKVHREITHQAPLPDGFVADVINAQHDD